MLLDRGLVLASDSRTNAGIDQIARVDKLGLMPPAADRVIVIQSAGNLGTTQAVVTTLREAFGSGDPAKDLHAARTMFEVANIVGATLREIVARDGAYVERYGDPSGSFLVSGQIDGEPSRLFQIYSAGNFVEASARSPFLQIGETKYGKPILDRRLSPQTGFTEAAKLALLSFDATIRSNLSVGPPIDLFLYRTDSFSADKLFTVEEDTPYWGELRRGYAEGLAAIVADLPPPPPAWEP
jgi:putative proteasome-type protease